MIKNLLQFESGRGAKSLPSPWDRVKVNKSIYIAKPRQRHDVTLNKFFLHVLNHAL